MTELMTRQQLISLLRVAESTLWELVGTNEDAARTHQEIASALRAVDAEGSCQRCGNPLANSGMGRPRRYCSDNCRKYAYAERKAS
ncbi:hypothetical protein OHB41_26055 [Streptomyces sp. NBC_01571]|uniref:hypothetical protein n=1 Tax=Streptomyces sp. NBC_01571 TaxID=2975883 RepID=UPI002256E609|nr:hypothetical protein [Streptomyces sp. NBC_01571]MCX4576575.1 hypothetical protein [Streptomyces sp. NBC_01571]